MSVLTIWDFYEFIVFTEEIPHLLPLQELLNIPHTKSELKCDESVAMDPEVDVKNYCIYYFWGIFNVVFHSHSYSPVPKEI